MKQTLKYVCKKYQGLGWPVERLMGQL